MRSDHDLAAKIEPFDSFWEAPPDVERGYSRWAQFYRCNYLKYLPDKKTSSILVISCGPGYFVKLLSDQGYGNVLGIDSDPKKVRYAAGKGLNCRVERAFSFLQKNGGPFDLIVCEQELNHLTKEEMVDFLHLCHRRLAESGVLLVHGLNGANPFTGAEALAQNFDHYNTFTAHSLAQVLQHCEFKDVRVFPLHLYVFYRNPLNYVAWAVAWALTLLFRAVFALYGKKNSIWSKKIGAVAIKNSS